VLRVTRAGIEENAPVVAFRAATGDDLAPVEALLRDARLPVDGVADCIGDFIVAESGGDVVGAIGLETYAPYGLLRSAAVAAAWRGKGIGRSLVNALLEDEKSQSLDAIYLLTTTAENYFPAFGFTRIARDDVPEELMESAEFRGACPASAVAMERVNSSRRESWEKAARFRRRRPRI
jgi:amino-acid N-acetyltransferase